MRAVCLFVLATGCGRLEFAALDDGGGDAAASTAYRDAVLASNPRAYYRLDETIEGVAADASGNGHEGSFGAAPGSTLALGVRGALSRDPDAAMRMAGDGIAGPGGNCSFEVDPTLMDWSGDFSVEMFVKPQAVPVASFYFNTVFLCESYLVSGFRFGWTDRATLRAWVDEGGGTTVMEPPQTFMYDEYMHVVLMHRGTSFVIYRDGVEIGQQVMDYVPVTQDAQCGTGAFHGNPTDGTFDELALYDRALDLAEIQSHLSAR